MTAVWIGGVLWRSLGCSLSLDGIGISWSLSSSTGRHAAASTSAQGRGRSCGDSSLLGQAPVVSKSKNSDRKSTKMCMPDEIGNQFLWGQGSGGSCHSSAMPPPWTKLAASRVRVLAAHDALHKGHNHGLEDHE